MSNIGIESGVVLGFGGTNARYGVSQEGDITGFQSVPTPEHQEEFFGWMARQVLSAADGGHSWLVAGFPGPVTADGKLVGPMQNIEGLSVKQHDLRQELNKSDPAIGRLIEEGFSIVAVNDGTLAAQAAALRVGQGGYDRVAALIVGTGVGAGVVVKDPDTPSVFRVNSDPLEIGNVVLSADPIDTFENYVSGPALERDYELNPMDMPSDHPAWERVGVTVGQMATLLGVMGAVELVVPCGGIGSGASEKYWPHLRKMLKTYVAYGNETQKLLFPEVNPIAAEDTQIFELFGGEGVMRDFRSRTSTTVQG